MPTVDDFLGGVVKKPRKPGDFLRMANDTPQVAHPTNRTKQGNRPNLVAYKRPSGLGSEVENQHALHKADERGKIKGAALSGPKYNDAAFARLLAHVDADDAKAVERTADSIAATWKGAARLMDAADRGTFIHKVIEGGTLDMAEADRLGIRPEHIDVVRKEWPAFLDRYGFEVLAQELAVVNDVYGTAGTCDLVLRHVGTKPRHVGTFTLACGDVIGADIKTGKLAVNTDDTPTYWGTYPVQLAAYFCGSWVYDADAHAADVEAGAYTWPDDAMPYRKPWPWELRQDVALIVHVDAAKLLAGQRSDLISLVPVDLEVGRQGAALATAIREWRKLDGCGPAIGPAANKDAQPVDDDSPSVVDLAEPTTATANAPHDGVVPTVAVVQTECRHYTDDPDAFIFMVCGGDSAKCPTPAVQTSALQPGVRMTVSDIVTSAGGFRTPQEQKAAIATSPDEGDDLNGEEYNSQWEALGERYNALNPAPHKWVKALRDQADEAGVGFETKNGRRYVRRFEILRGLILIAGSEWQASVRDFVFTCTNDENVHLDRYSDGTAAATLDATQAARFAQLCEYAVIGGLVAEPRDAFRIRYTLAA